MPSFGGYAGIFPIRFGGAKPVVQTITEALNESRGTAYDVTIDSTVWIDDHASARAIASIWQYNEMLANQADPLRLSVLLSRWETILGIPVDPASTPAARRRVVQAIVSRVGIAPTYQEMVDRLTVMLDPITFSIAHNAPSDAGVVTSWRGGWTVFSSGTTPPTVTLTGPPAGNYTFELQITTGGIVGVAMFRYTTDGGVTYSAAALTAASIVLGSTGLTVTFAAGTYATDNQYTSFPLISGFSSSVSKVTIVATKPTWMTENDFYSRTQAAFPLLDNWLPAWVTFDVVRDGSSVGEFILDEIANLDNQRLSAT